MTEYELEHKLGEKIEELADDYVKIVITGANKLKICKEAWNVIDNKKANKAYMVVLWTDCIIRFTKAQIRKILNTELQNTYKEDTAIGEKLEVYAKQYIDTALKRSHEELTDELKLIGRDVFKLLDGVGKSNNPNAVMWWTDAIIYYVKENADKIEKFEI